ncbi:MAG: hypothetical protein ABSF64_29570 [Bryobacteraceae bacterium]|jgi:hypothetical protein
MVRTLQVLALATALCPSVLTSPSAAQTSFTTLYKFDNPATGEGPVGVVAANGVLYGTTGGGGTYGAGTVSVAPSTE